MPLPKPRKGQSQSDFMEACVPEAIHGSEGKRPQEQAVAMCLNAWRDAHPSAPPPPKKAEVERIIKLWCKLLKTKQDVPEPDDDESRTEFMQRCADELEDGDLDDDEIEDACQMAWENRSTSGVSIVHKTHTGEVHGMEFVLSDESPDRMGEVINSSGWEIENFKKNPIALFSHDPKFIVGKWHNLRVDGTELKGKLQLAPKGASDRIDEIHALVDAGILKAVSVGFRPLKSVPLKEDARGFEAAMGPQRYLKQELVETSLVAIPANPNALAVAKSLNISPATCDLVFAGQGEHKNAIGRRGHNGGKADRSRTRKGTTMMSLAQRIVEVEAAIVAKKDELAAHWNDVDNSNVQDADIEKSTKLNEEIAQLEKQHTALIASEKLLAQHSDASNGGATRGRALSTAVITGNAGDGKKHAAANGGDGPIVFTRTMGGKELSLVDLIVRAGTVAYAAKIWNMSPDQARQKIYGDDDQTRVVVDIVTRAPSAPAITTVTGWAAELSQQIYTDLMPLLMPAAIFTRLSAKGLTLTFGRAGRIIIPTRNRTPTIAGSFVGEGQPIPVRQGQFTSQILTPKKMAVITTWTREMDIHSIPAIEGILREAVQQDTSVATDSVLIDANAATVIRPAGLLNGVAAITATAGGGLGALIGDIKLLTQALTANTYGNIRTPVWLVNPGDVISMSLANAPNTGIFPFKDEVARGTLANIPMIDSATVPSKTMILVDAADFVSVGGDGPRFEISDQATLHMEDSTPLELVGTGSPGTVAAPQRSLWQTDSLALRLVLPINWLQRRAGTVVWMQNVTWS